MCMCVRASGVCMCMCVSQCVHVWVCVCVGVCMWVCVQWKRAPYLLVKVADPLGKLASVGDGGRQEDIVDIVG